MVSLIPKELTYSPKQVVKMILQTLLIGFVIGVTVTAIGLETDWFQRVFSWIITGGR